MPDELRQPPAGEEIDTYDHKGDEVVEQHAEDGGGDSALEGRRSKEAGGDALGDADGWDLSVGVEEDQRVEHVQRADGQRAEEHRLGRRQRLARGRLVCGHISPSRNRCRCLVGGILPELSGARASRETGGGPGGAACMLRLGIEGYFGPPAAWRFTVSTAVRASTIIL